MSSKETHKPRREFIKQSIAAMALTTAGIPSSWATRPVKVEKVQPVQPGFPEQPIKFSVIGMNHGHIYGQIGAMQRAGGILVAYYAVEPELMEQFNKRYPEAKPARSADEIYEDTSIQLILSAAIPSDRADIGIQAMKHGKDFMSDKPGIISLEKLEEVKKVQKETGRIFSILYSERMENKASVKASELVRAGAIGKVVQTVNLAPHRMNIPSRPEWFFDTKYYGGIITDIGSHQVDQFLYYTGSTRAIVVGAQAGNVHYPQYPEFEDFGDAILRGNGGMGYIRVDWFTPDGLDTWGDGRLTILGTEGFIELRKYTDLAGRPGGNHLFLVDGKETRYIDCSDQYLPFGELFSNDILHRTETAMSQDHCFLATEVTLQAQAQAQRIKMEL
ncbi:MAG TPA: Gfo/Idh/MocA family oxidoreductase [Saprospiraceae bacterium]|nr:Gfo/Idh/MocA family oxidoreductase [Saprospiraceae bacterium]